jgi:hypothetical protein
MSDRWTQRYKYRPLGPDHNGRPEIRVIFLTPSIHVDKILHCRIVRTGLLGSYYCALSYAWGEPVFTKTLVVDENSFIPITENLDVALRRLRLASIRILWVDAVCINQQDVQERAQQIMLMGRVFSQAEKVLVWTELDNASRDGRYCLEFLDRISDRRSFSFDEKFSLFSIDQNSKSFDDLRTGSYNRKRNDTTLDSDIGQANASWLNEVLLRPPESVEDVPVGTRAVVGPFRALLSNRRYHFYISKIRCQYCFICITCFRLLQEYSVYSVEG